MEFRLQHLIIFLAFTTFATCRVIDTKGMDGEFYCRGRNQRELFRRKLSENATYEDYRKQCNVFYQCVAIHGGKKDISGNQCPQSMSFDVDIQTCQLHSKVNNCDQWEKFRPPVPRWPIPEGEESNCPDNQIECGSGECLGRELFCDDIADCPDGSDENACGPDKDPNAAPRCDLNTCKFKHGCFCSVDGTRIPNDLSLEDVPQMITISFSGAVTKQAYEIYSKIFSKALKNSGNDCTAKATFFVAHPFTNYSAVQELNRQGHEIALNSITNNKRKEYWHKLSYDDFFSEFDFQRIILNRFANISDESIIGMRVPLGLVGGNAQFKMMESSGLYYDSSITAPRQEVPIWPYFLNYIMPHDCIGTDKKCPSKNFTVLEMVLNELDRRSNYDTEEKLTGCHYIDSCNIRDAKEFRQVLDLNLNHHFKTNRAPFGIHFTAAYFLTRDKHLKQFIEWIEEKSKSNQYYFVTMSQAFEWILQPTKISDLNTFEPWKNKCDYSDIPACTIPNPCPKREPRLFPQEDLMYLHTCEPCPKSYPWIDNPSGDGFEDIEE